MKEKTFLAVKPDAVKRGDAQGIIELLVKLLPDAQCLAMKLYTPSKKLAEKHYEALNDKPFFPDLIKSFTSGPIVGMVWEGDNIVARARDAMGATDPAKAAEGTIRKKYGKHIGDNAIHGSDTEPGSATREVQIHFEMSELSLVKDPAKQAEKLLAAAKV